MYWVKLTQFSESLVRFQVKDVDLRDLFSLGATMLRLELSKFLKKLEKYFEKMIFLIASEASSNFDLR